ncbi:FosX/FosE/FosI family fosfomycin resistance hydrolase [Microvirga sp. G4-2]|uniref:FosX/FosE/FosI family fosfomycin resistance hydrolase n=1 Tax=Microvirga sp. G4-2 TaxID=3434467 RepID=UPI00404516D0
MIEGKIEGKIEGLSHITLITSDLSRMTAIVEQVLDGKEIYSSGDETFSLSREKFFIVGGQWIAVMEGESLPSRTYNHIAFKIPVSAIDDYRTRIESLSLEFREARPRVEGEGHSLYFYDHDNHLFELHTGTLEERLERYRQGLAA